MPAKVLEYTLRVRKTDDTVVHETDKNEPGWEAILIGQKAKDLLKGVYETAETTEETTEDTTTAAAEGGTATTVKTRKAVPVCVWDGYRWICS